MTAAAQGNSDEGCSPASEGHPRTGQANNRSPPSYWTRAIDSCQRGEMRANPVPSPPRHPVRRQYPTQINKRYSLCRQSNSVDLGLS